MLCCLHLCDVPYPFRHLGCITLYWVVWCLPILPLGDRALVLIFWSPRICHVICHWLDKRWWRQSQATITRISACWSQYLDGKLLQALLLAMAFRYWSNAGQVLSWVRAPLVLVSPYLEMLDSDLKVSCLLLIQQAPTQRFNYSTLDQWPLVEFATRSLGLRWLILALLILQRISCPFKETYILMTYTTKVILP